MAKEVTFKATDIRSIKAHETVQEFGPGYLNPLVGLSAAETCANVQDIIGFLHGIISSKDDIEEQRPALSLILQTVWSAVQYEGGVNPR